MESKLNCGGCAPAHATEHARDGIGRRTFLAQSALLAAGALLAACAASDVSAPGTTINSTTNIKVSDFPALASVGLGLAYGVYTVFAFVAIFFVIKFVKETKGRTLESMSEDPLPIS